MSTQPAGSQGAPLAENKLRTLLIFGSIGTLAAIIFGLLYLFVIAPAVPNGSLGWYLFSFATGLTMIVMPCTLPLAFVIVPLSMGKGLIRGIGMALAFGIGIATTLSLYGVAAALLGGIAIDALGADLESIKNWVYFVAGIFAFLFAISEIGLLNFHMPTYSGAAPAFIQKRQEIIKAFLLGLFLGNVGVGCPHPATPLILIEIASSGDVLYGWSLFLIHAIGRILPLLLLAFLAILGVNGLNWLMARKDAVERTTGWAMVFVAGFILTLGLFSHDWWVNSGLHSGLEAITQESKVNALLNDTLSTNVAHVHGLETGAGLFGLPLEWGSWFLVFLWLLPIWWWYFRKKKVMLQSPAFQLKAIEDKIDRLERDRRQVEGMVNMDEVETEFDLAAVQSQLDGLEKQRRDAESKVQFGEKGVYKEPLARSYEARILSIQRNYLLLVSVFLIIVFVHYMPSNFYLKSMSGMGHGADHAATTPTDTGMSMRGEKFTTTIAGLPDAGGLQFVELADGDTYDITASYVKKQVGNRTLRMLAYNGSIPGPFIKVKEGSTVTVNFTNNTDVDQTIHSHGLRLSNLYDGVPDITQNAVKPGETFVYTLTFPDAGIAWYHPHTRDDYGQEMGLYGNYLVDSNNSEYRSPVNREIPLIVDDILIENNEIAAFYKNTVDHALLGRFGNEYLVNGETDYVLDAEKGEVIRFLITNVSNARTYKLSIPGATMKVVGSEWGRFEQEEFKNDVLLSPAERIVVEAYFDRAGTFKLMHTMPTGEVELARFIVRDTEVATSYVDEFNAARRNTEEVALFNQYRQDYGAKTPDKNLLLTVSLMGMVDHSAHAHSATTATTPTTVVDESMPHAHGTTAATPVATAPATTALPLQWDDASNSDVANTSMNTSWIVRDVATGKEGMNIPVADWTFKQGALIKIRITNDANAAHVMQHPFHVHGQRFLVLSNNGVTNMNMAWKDTALVPPGEYIDVLVEMSNLGEWMAHCHISEHLHAGMMMPFRVVDGNGYATGDDYRKSKPAAAASTNTGHMMPDGTMMGGGAMPGGAGALSTSAIADKYHWSDNKADASYVVRANTSFFTEKKLESLQLSFYDKDGNPVILNEQLTQVLSVTFVKSDDSVKVFTYPGNTNHAPVLDDHHNTNMPASDGHNHTHSFLGINVAYAHGDNVTDGHHAAQALGASARTYTIPVVYPSAGTYRGFVEFILDGETAPRVATFDVEVKAASFTVDQFGWSKMQKWWILLMSSLILMVGLSFGVRKYLNIKK